MVSPYPETYAQEREALEFVQDPEAEPAEIAVRLQTTANRPRNEALGCIIIHLSDRQRSSMSEAPAPGLELGRRSALEAELLALLRESMAASLEHQRLANERMRRDLNGPPDLSFWKVTAIGVGIGLTGAAVAAAGMLFGRYVL